MRSKVALCVRDVEQWLCTVQTTSLHGVKLQVVEHCWDNKRFIFVFLFYATSFTFTKQENIKSTTIKISLAFFLQMPKTLDITSEQKKNLNCVSEVRFYCSFTLYDYINF